MQNFSLPTFVTWMVLLMGTALCPFAGAAEKPQRVCSLWLATDEVLLELVGADRLVCVNDWVDKTPRTLGKFPKHITRISNNVEKVLAARPDFVIATNYPNTEALIALLEQASIPHYVNTGWTSFDGITESILEIGNRVGEPQKAEKMVSRFRKKVAAIRQQAACDGSTPRVLYWGGGGGWVPGTETSLQDVIAFAGGTNAAAEKDIKGWEPFSLENVMALDPDVIIFDSDRNDLLGRVPALKKTRAYAQGRVFGMADTPITAVSPVVADAVAILARRMHPTCFAEDKK